MKKIRAFFRLEGVSRPARLLLKGTLALSCALLAAALLTAVYAGDVTARSIRLFYMTVSLYKAPLGLLLLASLGALVIDGQSKR